MTVTIEESNYFAGLKAEMIHKYITEHPEYALFHIGIIEGGDSMYVWHSESYYHNPKCECGWIMMQGTFIYKDKDSGWEAWTYWWCENSKCRQERHARFDKEISEYRQRHGAEPSVFAEALNKMGIPELCHAWTLGNFDNTKAKTPARKAMKEGESIFITGKTGSGKTHLAIGLLIENGHAEPNYYRFINVPKLILDLHSDVKADRDYAARIQNLTAVKVLVLDDMGAEKATEYVRAVLYELINERMMNGKPTIVTSNMGLKEIGENIDERLASRLSSFHIISITGTDRRAQRKAARPCQI